jgi:AcrR family transcriptional regulator
MRKINEAKRQSIVQAVYQITYDEGITNLSIAKIAKKVGVSKATMYVYYDDKTDMLGKIFLEVKRLMDDGLLEAIPSDLSFKQRVKNVLTHFANKFIEYPYEANFMRAIQANPDLVDKNVIEQSEKMAKPIDDLLHEGIENHYWISDDPLILTSLAFAPIVQLVENLFKSGQSIPKEKITEMIDIMGDLYVVE